MSVSNWLGLVAVLLTALGIGGSILCFMWRIAERLGTIAKSLARIELDLTNNQAEHHELFGKVGKHSEQIGKHDVRITNLEQASRRGSQPIGLLLEDKGKFAPDSGATWPDRHPGGG